ncbi:DUF222 domain-containing protein [Arthrobacter psychrolactophilus]
METTAMRPGQGGSPRDGKTAGEHIHQLLTLAGSLVRTAADAQLETPLGVQLASLTDHDAAAWAQNLEHLNRYLQGLMVQAAGELSQRVAAGRFQDVGARTSAEYLSSSLKLSRAEATRRIHLAERVLPQSDAFLPFVATERQEVLGSALFSGKVSLEQSLIISGFVDQATALARAGKIAEDQPRSLEETLTQHAENEPPYFLRHLGIRALALLAPDGEKPSESQRLAKQGLFFHKAYKGWVRMDGYLTIPQYEHTLAYIGWASNIKRKDPADQQGDLLQQLLSENDFSGEIAEDSAAAVPEQSPGQPLWTADTGETGADCFEPPPRPTLGTPLPTQGWRQPLNPEDIPAKPPDAPEWAIPPVYEGESWFWFPDLSNIDNGWIPRAGDNPAPGKAPDEGEDADAPSTDPGPEPFWWGSPAPSTAEQADPWPRLVNGIWVPEPGSGERLLGLSSTDPNSTDPATHDRRSDAQKLLDGMIDCLKLAASTDKLPLNGGLKPQLYLSLTQEDLEPQGKQRGHLRSLQWARPAIPLRTRSVWRRHHGTPRRQQWRHSRHWPYPALVHLRPTQDPRGEGSGMCLPRLHGTGAVDGSSPHHPVAGRRRHQRR